MYLTELELDALKEAVNIGVGYAASALNQLVGSPVRLQVPELGILTLAQAAARVESMGGGVKASVELGFSGVLTGSAALVFPTDSAASLAALLTDDQGNESDLDGLRAATLEETGNLILNGVVGSIANLLHDRVFFSIPYYSEHPGLPPRLAGCGGPPEPHVIFARARFTMEEHQIEGDLLMFFETESVDRLKEALHRRDTPRVILLVDDSAFARRHIRTALHDTGYDVVEVGDGLSALEAIEHRTFDCIITDLLMPRLDGLGLLEELRRRKVDAPVIVLSADVQNSTHTRCEELGAAGFVPKPVNGARLRSLLTSLL